MLAREHRILNSVEFRMVMTGGRRMTTPNFIFFIKRDATLSASRFGFIVSKQVGGAVVRNAVKRKLRAQAQIAIRETVSGQNFWLVARALPAAAFADSATIGSELANALAQVLKRVES